MSPPTGTVPDLTIGVAGIPPVVSALLPYIASKEGFYKDFGVNVTLKSFTTGNDATRAVITGQVDIAIPSPVQQIQTAVQGTPLIGIMGQEKPDWVIASSDPSINTCEKLKGQSPGVEAIGGIRYAALAQMLRTCSLSIKDVHPLVFPGNQNPQAVIAGQLKVSVLHLNEVIQVEEQMGKPMTTVVSMAKAVPNTLYDIYVVQQHKLTTLRPALVRFLAAQIATLNWMFDPQNADEVAQLASVTGDSVSTMKSAMAQYKEIGFWTLNGDGMPVSNMETMIKNQIAAGNIKESEAPKAESLIDPSLYVDAQKLVSRQ